LAIDSIHLHKNTGFTNQIKDNLLNWQEVYPDFTGKKASKKKEIFFISYKPFYEEEKCLSIKTLYMRFRKT